MAKTIPVKIYEDTTLPNETVAGRKYTYPQKYDIWVKGEYLVRIITWYKNGKPSSYGAVLKPTHTYDTLINKLNHPVICVNSPIEGYNKAVEKWKDISSQVRDYEGARHG